jgi:hypothetical protein
MPFIDFFVGIPLSEDDVNRRVGVVGPRDRNLSSRKVELVNQGGESIGKTVVGSSKDFIRINLIPDFLEEYYEKRFKNGRRVSKFVLFDAAWDFLESAILPRRNNVRWRFGWVTNTFNQGTVDSGLRDGIVIYYQPSFTYQGNRLTIEVADVGNFRDNAVYTRFFNAEGKPVAGISKEPEPARISDVVRFLAEEMGLSHNIEETGGKFSPIQQRAETNSSFIERVLLPRARAEFSGRKDFTFSIDGAVLTFRPPGVKVQRRFFYGRDIMGTMLAFKPRIDKNQIWNGSYSNNTTVGFDPLSKKSLISEIDTNVQGKQDKKRIQFSESGFIAPRSAKSTAGRLYVTPYDDAVLIQEFARYKHEIVTWKVFQADAIIIGDPSVLVDDWVDIILLTNQGDVHYTSGVYQVLEVVHKIRRGSFTTDLRLSRLGHSLSGGKALGDIKVDLKKLFRDEERDNLRWKAAEPMDTEGLKKAFQGAFGGRRR